MPVRGTVRLEEDSSVRDRNHIRRDICRDITGLRFHDRQRGQRTAALGITGAWPRACRRLCRKHRRIGLASRGRRISSEKAHTIGNGMLGQVIVDDEGHASLLFMKYSPIAQPACRGRYTVSPELRMRGHRHRSCKPLHRFFSQLLFLTSGATPVERFGRWQHKMQRSPLPSA